MSPNAPLFPERGSALAASVDHLVLYALAGAFFFSLLIAVLILVFAVKFRRRHPDEVGYTPAQAGRATAFLEIAWSGIPFLLLMVLFAWGAKVYFAQNRPPKNALEFYVIGKQWMWKLQHPSGRREINELHVPIGVPIKLTMTSEDVIHDFYVPAFRVHVDVLPARYTTFWFTGSRIGRFHLFCSQYCGVEHSKMVGWVTVMEPRDYEAWLSGRKSAGPTATGAELFVSRACNTCHRSDSAARAPILDGLFGRTVLLANGRTIVADDTYVRESILDPAAKIVAGYQPIMPTFKGTLSEEEIVQLISYIKSLSARPAAPVELKSR